MKNIAKTTLLTGSLLASTFLAGQGNGNVNGALLEVNCRPTTIIGEENPTLGEEYTYNHDYEYQNGEEFVWEVEGASEVDGVTANQNGTTELTKTGKGINVVWNEQRSTGRIKVKPATDCAQLAHDNGGIGGIKIIRPIKKQLSTTKLMSQYCGITDVEKDKVLRFNAVPNASSYIVDIADVKVNASTYKDQITTSNTSFTLNDFSNIKLADVDAKIDAISNLEQIKTALKKIVRYIIAKERI